MLLRYHVSRWGWQYVCANTWALEAFVLCCIPLLVREPCDPILAQERQGTSVLEQQRQQHMESLLQQAEQQKKQLFMQIDQQVKTQ
eukprot:3165078-Amphidinium_carterae.1